MDTQFHYKSCRKFCQLVISAIKLGRFRGKSQDQTAEQWNCNDFYTFFIRSMYEKEKYKK